MALDLGEAALSMRQGPAVQLGREPLEQDVCGGDNIDGRAPAHVAWVSVITVS